MAHAVLGAPAYTLSEGLERGLCCWSPCYCSDYIAATLLSVDRQLLAEEGLPPWFQVDDGAAADRRETW